MMDTVHWYEILLTYSIFCLKTQVTICAFLERKQETCSLQSAPFSASLHGKMLYSGTCLSGHLYRKATSLKRPALYSSSEKFIH